MTFISKIVLDLFLQSAYIPIVPSGEGHHHEVPRCWGGMRLPRAWSTPATSPGGTRVASPGHYRPRPGPTAVKGESPDAAVARRLARRISRGASGPLITGCPRQLGPVWRNPDHASSRRAIPLARRQVYAVCASLTAVGTGKETGHPAPAPRQGPAKPCLFSRLPIITLFDNSKMISRCRPREGGDP